MIKLIFKAILIFALFYNTQACIMCNQLPIDNHDDRDIIKPPLTFETGLEDISPDMDGLTRNTEMPPPSLQSVFTLLPRCKPGYILVGTKCRKMV